MPQSNDDRKLAGTLYLDLDTLKADIDKANKMLQDIGKSIGPFSSSVMICIA